jgi:hypothetical protein
VDKCLKNNPKLITAWFDIGTDQNSDFIFTIDDESKGLDMKGGSEKIVSIGALRA